MLPPVKLELLKVCEREILWLRWKERREGYGKRL